MNSPSNYQYIVEVFADSINKLQTTAQYFSFTLFIITLLLFVSVQTSEDTMFPEKSCRGSRKALFKDLDGSVLNLEPPVAVFPNSEFEWTQFYLQAGKCLCSLECLQSHDPEDVILPLAFTKTYN